MMRILIVGGGPAGLFFALMAQRCVPGAEIQVREQNPGGVTYGWGFGFTQSALDALRPAAPDVIGQLEGNCPHEVMEMVLNGEAVQVAGDPMHSNARWALLDVLESAARAEGVRIEHDVVTTLEESDLDEWDLVIGADGVNSRTREAFADAFEPSVFLTDNWLAWYGTSRKFHPSIILQDTDHGVVMAHASQFSDDLSNFTVEVGQEAFESLGFAGLMEEESVALCQELFAAHHLARPLRKRMQDRKRSRRQIDHLARLARGEAEHLELLAAVLDGDAAGDVGDRGLPPHRLYRRAGTRRRGPQRRPPAAAPRSAQ